MINCAALILTITHYSFVTLWADPWYKFGLLERENDKEGNSGWQTLQSRTTGYQLSIPDLYYTIRTKCKIPGKTDLFLCADVTHYELYTTGRSRSGTITIHAHVHPLIMPVINQSIILIEKFFLKITCKSPLILKKTHSHATQAFVSYDLVLFRSHSVTNSRHEGRVWGVGGRGVGGWRDALGLCERGFFLLAILCLCWPTLSSALHTASATLAQPVFLSILDALQMNPRPGLMARLKKKKSHSEQLILSPSLPRQRDRLTAKLTNCHHLWW